MVANVRLKRSSALKKKGFKNNKQNINMKVEFNLNDFDEIEIGMFMAYGEDDNGSFHQVSFGFVVFSISFIRYV